MSTPLLSDMDDSGDTPESQPLHDILTHCQEHIYPAFRASDDAAVLSQKKHRRLAQRVAWLGSAATILATFQLFAGAVRLGDFSKPAEYLVEQLRWVELVVVLVMITLVLHGMRTASQENWLLERFKAERLRLLKFAFLLDPTVWSHDEKKIQRAKDDVSLRVDEIGVAARPSLDRWLSEGTVPAVWAAPEAELTKAELDDLVDYFRLKRLGFQMKYLGWATKRALERDQKSRLPMAVLFFGSVTFVLVHVAVEAAHGNDLSQFFVFLAAVLPALSTPVRIVRSAYESARNASRFEANYNTLSALSERLKDAQNSAAVFRELGFCEQVLEADHREWMRLMVEAEWFG